MPLVQKLLNIHSIKLPTDVINVIISFCFYDVDAAEKIKRYKLVKDKNVKHISKYIYYNGFSDGQWEIIHSFYPSDCEYEDEDPLEDLLNAAVNCLKCGNYKRALFCDENSNSNILSDKIICKC